MSIQSLLEDSRLLTTAKDVSKTISIEEAVKHIPDNVDGVIALYFSASWCPPCRVFTPVLSKFYNDALAAGKPFQCIYISSDQDEESFQDYFSHMSFLALPFDAMEIRNKLASEYKIKGIPTLVFVNRQGKLLTKEGKKCIADAHGDINRFEWNGI
jgi:nucleoredoxin